SQGGGTGWEGTTGGTRKHNHQTWAHPVQVEHLGGDERTAAGALAGHPAGPGHPAGTASGTGGAPASSPDRAGVPGGAGGRRRRAAAGVGQCGTGAGQWAGVGAPTAPGACGMGPAAGERPPAGGAPAVVAGGLVEAAPGLYRPGSTWVVSTPSTAAPARRS